MQKHKAFWHSWLPEERPARCMVLSAALHTLAFLVACLLISSVRPPRQEPITLSLCEVTSNVSKPAPPNPYLPAPTQQPQMQPPRQAPRQPAAAALDPAYAQLQKSIAAQALQERATSLQPLVEKLPDENGLEDYAQNNARIQAHLRARQNYDGLAIKMPPGAQAGLLREGGSQATQNAVVQGLDWLARHQDQDGRWDAAHFNRHCQQGTPCNGTGRRNTTAGVSGLALLAFLGAGHTPWHGVHRKVVLRGLQYLQAIQKPDGCFAGYRQRESMYEHAICTLAMTEAYIQTHRSSLKRSASKALAFLVEAQNPGAGWRYCPRSGDNDTSVTGWCLMALKSGRVAELYRSRKGFQWAAQWLDQVTDQETGGVGYTCAQARNEVMTAVGMISRIFIGIRPSDIRLRKGAQLLGSNLPRLTNINYYYWYYGTMAMFQMGGTPWRQWNKALKSVLLELQVKSGCARGSWPATSKWGRIGGRVYATALNVLSLEIYYRYPRVFK